MFDVLTLTVERVVDNPVRLVLGAVETALDVASRRRTGLLGQTEAEALHVALRKHSWEYQLGDWCCTQLRECILKLKCDEVRVV